MAPTIKTSPKHSKTVDDTIQPLTPAQAHEPSSLSASLPLRRRSLRLASMSNSDLPQCDDGNVSSATPVRVSDVRDSASTGNGNGAVLDTAEGNGRRRGKGKLSVESDDSGKGFLNLRSGKKVLKRGNEEVEQDNAVSNGSGRRSKKATTQKQGEDEGNDRDNAVSNGNESAKRSKKTRTSKQEEEEGKVTDSVVDEVRFEAQNVVEGSESVDSDKKGKSKLGENDVVARLSREEKGKAVAVEGDSPPNAVVPEVQLENLDVKDSQENAVPLRDREQPRNANDNNPRDNGSRRMDRFRDIARENASRFAHFAAEEEENNDDLPLDETEVEPEIEDWPGPFSTAMKIIRDREAKNVPAGCSSSERSLVESIKWVPRRNQGHIGGRFFVPSLQEHCLKILAKNVDAIVSLDSVPDALRHRLSQLLCDSRKMDSHFFELLVCGSPTEIRLRDCSWLSEEKFTKAFQMCDTANLIVLQLDQCGRCLPDYVILTTLAQSPGHLPRLTSLSVRGACRLSDVGLQALVTSAPALRSINLGQCSLLTSKSVSILAESLRSLLKELYLDECQGVDATTIVPALVELEHLEVLSLAGIHTVCDEFVKDYIIARGHNMKELVLKDCINLTDRSMKVIAEHCPGLCVLDIMNLSKLTDLSMGYLTNGCRALHTLKLCRNPFSDEAIAAFVETTGESLKELSLNNIKKVGYHTTLSLANHAKNLHTLDLSWCRNLTDNALGLIVDSCSTLRLLKLFGCTLVTDVFVNGHSNKQIQIIGLKMSPVLQHVKVPDPHQGALNYSSVSVDLV